ncbi:MAG: ATP-dependent sacrificial sulfur transferase LarE [Actinobacteria bacterium]|nr:MAG: ATP-dependent sacrificial sulfur transferase LarE [Actinomycetota bacterium]
MEPVDRSDALKGIIAELPGAIVAYSGGADSAFLADVAHEVLGPRSIAVTAVSESLAPDEREQAAALARARGWRHEEIRTREIERHEYRRNEPDRCFHCKDELFVVLDRLAIDRRAVVLVGTNADDTGDFRPGLRAAREHGVRAPLLESGLHKEEIRELSRARGLPTWDKPASACLASRIAYGIEVTPERLDRVAQAEAFIRSLGPRQLRVRDHGDLARIEVPLEEVEQLTEPTLRAHIVERLKGLGFAHVTLDLEGFRSGSMNASLLSIGRAKKNAEA